MGAAFLLASLWVAFGSKDASRDEGVREPGEVEPVGLSEADALSKRLIEERDVPRPPAGFSFRRDAGGPVVPPDSVVAGIQAVEARLEGFTVVLHWVATKGATAGGYLVERLAHDGSVASAAEVSAAARSWRDEPVDALRGKRSYRVSALDDSGEATSAPPQKVDEEWSLPVEWTFMGAEPDGAARIGVTVTHSGGTTGAEFLVRPGDDVGGRREGEGEVPGMDWNTGLVYRGLRGVRQVSKDRVAIPRFGRDGGLVLDPESGEVVREEREVPVSRVVEQAGVSRKGAPDDIDWRGK